MGNISFSSRFIALAKPLLLNVPPNHTVPKPKEVQYKITFSKVYPKAIKLKSSFSQAAVKK